MPDPLPCPFCGSSRLEVKSYRQRGEHHLVRCKTCNCTGPTAYEALPAVTLWNRRAGANAGKVVFLRPRTRGPKQKYD